MQQKAGHHGFVIPQEPSVPESVNDHPFKKKEEQLASQMVKENYEEELYHSIVD